MAIKIRRGNAIDFDKNKLVTGELGLVLDRGELYFCYSPGNVKQLQTAEDLQNLLDASPEAYQALQQLIADLTANPNELANILSNISALQNGKIDKTSIVQTDTINDPNKVASSAVTFALGQEIDSLNNNLVTINNRLNRFRSYTVSDSSYTSSTLTQQVEAFWANIETNTFGLIQIGNISDQWLAFYFKTVGNWGRVYILPGGGLTSMKWGQVSGTGVWTWH